MSILVHRNHTNPRFGSGGRRAHIQSALRASFGFVRDVVLRAGKLIVDAVEIIAEARAQRAMLESALYLNRYSRTMDSRRSKKKQRGDHWRLETHVTSAQVQS